MASTPSLAFILSSLLLLSSFSEAHPSIPLAKGLSWDYYKKSCPQVKAIVAHAVFKALRDDIGIAAGLIRIHFHDCFVQGCDGSVLLTGTAEEPSEQQSVPNLTLRPEGLALIDEIRDKLEKACGLVVSCADIAALASRDSVFLSGGPFFEIPLGRRDGLTFATNATVLDNLPAPVFPVSALLASFQKKNLNATDLVALSGAHTIGRGHCPAFANRLFPTQDPTLDPGFAKGLFAKCPDANSLNFTVNDILTPNAFDNRYYVNLANQKGLFTSDEGLFFDNRTRPIVEKFAKDQWVFFEKFSLAMIKMSQLDVLTGGEGEIRKKCTVPNSVSEGLQSVLGDAAAEEKPAVV